MRLLPWAALRSDSEQEALLTRVSRAQSSATPHYPATTKLLLASIAIEPVSIFLLFLCEPWETTVLFKSRLPFSLAQSFYIKSLDYSRFTPPSSITGGHGQTSSLFRVGLFRQIVKSRYSVITGFEVRGNSSII
jgi:hypothetical protein